MAPLTRWVAAHAATVEVASDRVDPVAPAAAYGDGDRAIYARRELQPDAVLVTLHAGAQLNGSSWLARQLASEAGESLRDELTGMQLSATLRTTLALLAERALGEKSAFHGYIEQLPTTISLPLSWDVEHRSMLQHTTAYVPIASIAAVECQPVTLLGEVDACLRGAFALGLGYYRAPIVDHKLVHDMYARFVAPLAKSFPTLWLSDDVTLERFLWAYSVVSSRAFTVADAQEPTLLPVIDMANHDAENPAAQIVKTEGGSFQVRASLLEVADIPSPPLSQLLCRYGFVLPASISLDCIRITSSELTKAFAAFSQSDDEDDDATAEADEKDEEDEPVARPDGRGKGKAKAKAKRRKLRHPESEADGDDALFFLLHGDAEREFGLGEALLSFVLTAQLPAERLYDVLARLLQEKDQQYSAVLASSAAASAELNAIQQLSSHERQVCRRILLGLLSLEESSSSSEDEFQ
ncbi:hypothetical protein BBJ28_00019252 [Nothophytophthora sp. Chile5]|nr:hypothetical protein BBJ28_00019252 [Nothophytophthora sp. Chile5]